MAFCFFGLGLPSGESPRNSRIAVALGCARRTRGTQHCRSDDRTSGEGAFAPDPLLLPLKIQNTCKFVLELAFLSEEWTVQRAVGSRVQDCLFREQFSAKNTRVKGAVESGGKWRSWDNSRIILLFPNC